MALLDGKVVIVTGAAAGIAASGHSATGFAADARDRDGMAKVVDAAIERFGRIEGLINVAGIYPRQPFLQMTEEQWDTMQEVNLKSVFHCTSLVMPHMVEQRSGSVVNISSVTFFTGLENLTHYIASKGGMIGFTRGLAREMGPHNVRVNCITPGAIETEGERKLMSKEQADKAIDLQSLKRRISPRDIARVCLFLTSDLSDAMTGQTLNVDGGWIMY